MQWQRPTSVPVGRVWARFKGSERDGKPALMYQIRDMGEYKQQCLDMMEEIFLRDEPLCDVLGIRKDPVSIATIRANWEQYVSQEVSLACLTERDGAPDELVAANILLVRSRGDPDDEDIDQVAGESWKKLLLTLVTCERLVDVFQHYQVERYLTASGLTVVPHHRGQNIGARMFDARRPLARALGVQATCTVFTAGPSQALAAKCGYSVLAELPYADMAARGVPLAATTTPAAKLMGTKFTFA